MTRISYFSFTKTQALRTISLPILAAILASPALSQTWTDIDPASQAAKQLSANEGEITPTESAPILVKSRKLRLSLLDLEQNLRAAPLEQPHSKNVTIELPLPHGGMQRFTLYNSPILSPSLARKRPDIQTYKIIDPDNPQNQGRLDLTSEGFHAIFTQAGRTVLIDPSDQDGIYQSYYRSDYNDEMSRDLDPIICSTGEHIITPGEQSAHNHLGGDPQLLSRGLDPAQAGRIAFGTSLRTFRLAIAVTGEYSEFFVDRGIDPEDQIVTSVNRMNSIFEPEAAIRLVLEDTVVHSDGATDPYTNNDAQDLIDEVVGDLNANVGIANFDIGHVFATGISGGLAQLRSACSPANRVNNSKAAGVSGFANPRSNLFHIDILAHEIGHQFGADHSFNGTVDSCGTARANASAYEPAGGTTIMGYAGICGSENIQIRADEYFHSHSLEQMSDFIDTLSCSTDIALSNNIPDVIVGPDRAIPISTPFTLTGSATDSDSGDTLSYNWEQYDRGAPTSALNPLAGDNTGPIFRSFDPVATPSRTFPQPSDILNGTTTFGEVMPTITRDMTFRLTVRDGNGGVTSEDLSVAVSAAAGPFTASTPAGAQLTGASNATLEWDVANTTAAPISCALVDIDLSTDGGVTFPTQLADDTPNDGTQTLSIPNGIDSTSARLRVSCSTQPFFAINPSNFTIASTAVTNTPPIAQIDSYTVDENSASILLDVLSNDSDDDGDTLSLTSITAISNGGDVTIEAAQIRYQPAADFDGTETFTYTVSDGNGATDSAQVTVTVNDVPAPNTAPNAVADSFTVTQDSANNALDVLDNDTDIDSDSLSILSVTAPATGAATLNNGQIL